MASLSSVPPEVLQEILSHLLPVSATEPTSRHAFVSLSLTSRWLQSAVEGYSKHLLSRLSVRFPSPRSPFRPPYVRTYLRHASAHCLFCNRVTLSVARVFNDIRCCRACNTNWSALTLSECRTEWRLPKELLLQRCQYGEYTVWGVRTTVFLESDVMKLAREVHGDLDAWIEKRTDKWKERYRKRKGTSPTSGRPRMQRC